MLLDVTGDGLDDLVVTDIPPPQEYQPQTTEWKVAPSFGLDPAASLSLYVEDPALPSWYTQQHPNAPEGEVDPEIGSPIDYDQDGRMDLLLHDIYGAHATWQVLRSLPQHGFDLVDTGITHPFPPGALPPFPITRFDAATHLADVTGDGVSDLIQCVYDQALYFSYWKLYPWGPDFGATGGFDPTGYLISELESVPCTADVRTVDVDADSRVDLLVQHFIIDPFHVPEVVAGTTYDALHFLSTTTATTPPISLWQTRDPELALPPAGQPIVLLDVNGDGLMDAVMPDSNALALTTCMNDGTKFLPAVGSLAGAIPGMNEAAHFRLAIPIDFDEDGRQDLLMPMGEANINLAWRILRATGSIGSGTFELVDPSVTSTIPLATLLQGAEVALWHPRAPRVTDIDGDGVQDLMVQTDEGFTVWKNHLAEEDRLASVTDGMNAFDEADAGFLPNVRVHYGHLIDRATTFGVTEGSSAWAEELYLPKTDLLLGGAVDLASDCVFPRRCMVGSKRVVASYELNNGANLPRSFEVKYRDGRTHRLGRGFLGFGSRMVLDRDTGAGTLERFDHVSYDPALRTYPGARQVAATWRWTPGFATQPDPSLIELAFSAQSRQTVPTYDGVTYFQQRVLREERREQGSLAFGSTLAATLAYVKAAEVSGALSLSRSFEIVEDYDEYGNVKAETTFADDVDLQTTTTRVFTNDPASWQIGQLDTMTECSSAAGSELCRTRSRFYDVHGQVQTELTDSADDPENHLQVSFERDAFGNIVKTTAYDAFAQHRTSCTSYEAEGIFPFAHGNPVGHISYALTDPRFGVPLASVDANGLVTQWGYDGLGRATKELRPDGTTTSIALSRAKNGGPLGNEWAVEERTIADHGGDDTVRYDSLGRAIRWLSQDVPDVINQGGIPVVVPNRIVSTLTFDALGEHVLRRSVPVAEGTQPAQIYYDTYAYDAAGRVVRHETPWLAVTESEYLGRTLVVHGPTGDVTVSENDPLGRPVSISSSGIATTEYVYGPFGGLESTTDPGDATTTTERDAFGRVRVETHPDRGVTTAHYTGFGELTSSLDAAGRKTTLLHDRLARLIRRYDDDGTTAWKWDTAQHGVGRLASVTAPSGQAKKTLAYDALGRPTTTTLTLNSETFVGAVAYDAWSRVDTITYPGAPGIASFAVTHSYDHYGHLTAVRDAATHDAYWQLSETDGAGRITRETFGNGLETVRSYYPERDRVKSISTSKVGSGIVFPTQSLRYDYTKKLNLLSRTDVAYGQSEYFRYDELDRLTCTTLGGPFGECDEKIDYAPNGNILSRSGNDYTYDPSQPHAARGAGSQVFDYDEVGNQVLRPGFEKITYTARNLPRAFEPEDATAPTVFDYDGNGERLRKTGPGAETIYFGSLYERVRRQGSVVDEHRYYVRSSGRVVAVVTRTGVSPDETRYLHTDNLGSVDVLTDGAGAVVERRSYTAFGARRNPTWNQHTAPASSTTTLGFTGHEDEEDLGLVNMLGRIYDPVLGRFLTTDPVVSKATFGQSLNAYSYVLNNPLAYVDPTGLQEADGPVEVMREMIIVGDRPQTISTRNPTTEPPPPPPPPPAHPDDETDDVGQMLVYDAARAQPVDASRTGHSGAVPSPKAAPEQTDQGGFWGIAAIMGQLDIGAVEGTEELATSTVTNLSPVGPFVFGYGLLTSVIAGYEDGGGVIGVVNTFNPLYQIGVAGAASYMAAAGGDYRAAGAAGAKGAIVLAASVCGLRSAFGPGRVPGTGAFAEGAQGGTGLGKLAGRSIQVSEKGLGIVKSHLSRFGPFPENAAMVSRLQGAFARGSRIGGADASFYLHEVSEATMMGRGLSYEAAHAGALAKYEVSPFSVYHPSVIAANPGAFNSNWFTFWGLR